MCAFWPACSHFSSSSLFLVSGNLISTFVSLVFRFVWDHSIPLSESVCLTHGLGLSLPAASLTPLFLWADFLSSINWLHHGVSTSCLLLFKSSFFLFQVSTLLFTFLSSLLLQTVRLIFLRFSSIKFFHWFLVCTTNGVAPHCALTSRHSRNQRHCCLVLRGRWATVGFLY